MDAFINTLKTALTYAKFKDPDIATATYKLLAEADVDLIECNYVKSGEVLAAIDAVEEAVNNTDAETEKANKKLSALEAAERDYDEYDEDTEDDEED